MSGGGVHGPDGQPPEEEPVRDGAHMAALGVMILTPLALAALVYGILKALSG